MVSGFNLLQQLVTLSPFSIQNEVTLAAAWDV